MQSRHFGLAGKKQPHRRPPPAGCYSCVSGEWRWGLLVLLQNYIWNCFLSFWFFPAGMEGSGAAGGSEASEMFQVEEEMLLLFIVFPSTALCTQLLSAASLLIAAGGSEKRQSFLSRCPKTIQILQHHFILLYVMCNYMCSDAGTLRFNIHCSDRVCFGTITLVFRWKHTLVFYFFLQLHKATTYFDSSVGWKVTWDLLNSSSQKQIKPGPVTLVITQQDVGTTTQSV